MIQMSRTKPLLIMALLILTITGCSRDAGEVEERTEAYDPATASWPIFRGDTSLSGIAEDGIPDRLKLKWTFKTGSWIVSTPVIGYGRVFIGSTDGLVYSLDLLSGERSWEFDTEDDIEASPLLLESVVYIGNLSGDFFALDAESGELKWKSNCGNSIYGSANWFRDPGGERFNVIVGSYDARLYCFDAASGELKWTYETDNYINGAPATDGEVVVFGGCDELLHIVELKDGTKVGEVWAGSYIPGSAALVDKRAYVGHYDNQLVCIDVEAKEKVWTYEDREQGGPFFSSPAIGEDRIVIGSRDSFLHCLERKTGERIWTFRTRDEIDSSPVIAGDKVVIGSVDGRLYVVSLAEGGEMWSYEIGAPIIGSPAVAGGFVVIGADDGIIYAFGEDS